MMVRFLIFAMFLTLLLGCKQKRERSYDFDEIKASGKLTIITLNSSTTYFIYKDEPMGFVYDLAKDFCDFYGLNLEIKVAENSTRLQEMLLKGEGDLIATPINVQNELKDSIIYCGLEIESHQVLVQRNTPKDSLITDVTQLIGKDVYVKRNTQYYQRLVNLDNELGNGIAIKDVEKDTVTVEDLIEMVALNKINYTIADEFIAKLNKTYHHNINIALPLSFEQRQFWAVRKNMPQLAQALNDWYAQNKQSPVYKAITKKYFELSKLPPGMDDLDGMTDIVKGILKTPSGAISPFDSMFKKYESVAGYDWFLLAAIGYQESRFRTHLTSWAGAMGLMGLMPRTARAYGVSNNDLNDPEMSIKGAAHFIAALRKIFAKIPDPNQRVKFVLASYNGGNGHVADAQALARKYGDDPYVWDGSVEKYIELKSKPEYYNDPVCKNGYLRSKEVLNYVKQVTANWHKFKTNYNK